MYATRQRVLVALAFLLVFVFQRYYYVSLIANVEPHTKSWSTSSTASDDASQNTTDASPTASSSSNTTPSPTPQPAKSKYAYVTFLSSTTVDNTKPDDSDVYFVGARVLTYQLLHDPKTRTQQGIPFVIAVTRDVPQSKRNRLVQDGADIIEVERLTADWINTEQRYSEVMTKLRIAAWTQFDRVMFLDVDTIITDNIDGIFDDPAARVRRNLQLHVKRNVTDAFKLDEGEQPKTYVFAGTPSLKQGHSYPPTVDDENLGGHWINGGFWVMRPAMDLFEHYTRVLHIENRFGTWYPEECLLNYVHRNGGNMPWSGLDYKWGVSGFPSLGDYEAGVKSLHEKWWSAPDDLKPYLERARWQMDGYWKGKEEGLGEEPTRFRSQSGEKGAGTYGSGLGTSGG